MAEVYTPWPKNQQYMNDHPIKYFVLLLIVNSSIGCSKVTEKKPPDTPSKVLNDLVQSSQFQYVNLDEYDLNGMVLNENDIIFNLSFDDINEEALLGHLTKYFFMQGSFYIYDIEVNNLFKIDTTGTVEGPLTTIGRGPGEHISVFDMKINSQFIYISDPLNGRINRYTVDFTPYDELRGYTSMHDFDLNDDKILSVNHQSIRLNPVNPEQGVIVVSSTDGITDTLATLLPRIIPDGYQPVLYNIPRFSINNKNIIAASYQFLPWIFLYDEHYSHMTTLILEYSKFERLDIPEMVFFKNLDNQGFGGDYPFTGFKLMPDNEIFIFIRRELIHLAPLSDNTINKYEVIGRYTFKIAGEDEPLWISDIFPGKNTNEFYVGSWYNIFRFTISRL